MKRILSLVLAAAVLAGLGCAGGGQPSANYEKDRPKPAKKEG